MDTILNRISEVGCNLDSELSDLAARVTTVEGSIEKVTKNLQLTTLVANDAHDKLLTSSPFTCRQGS